MPHLRRSAHGVHIRIRTGARVAAGPRPPRTTARWLDVRREVLVVDADALGGRWALAWDDGQGNGDLFQPELLDDPDTFVVAGYHVGGEVVAGAVAYRGDGVVGVSNVFAEDGNPDTAWPLVLSAAHSRFPRVRVVGYMHGGDVEAAPRHGFEIVGPFRVWTKKNS